MCGRTHVGVGGFPDLAALAAAAIDIKLQLGSRVSDSRNLVSVRVARVEKLSLKSHLRPAAHWLDLPGHDCGLVACSR